MICLPSLTKTFLATTLSLVVTILRYKNVLLLLVSNELPYRLLPVTDESSINSDHAEEIKSVVIVVITLRNVRVGMYSTLELSCYASNTTLKLLLLSKWLQEKQKFI